MSNTPLICYNYLFIIHAAKQGIEQSLLSGGCSRLSVLLAELEQAQDEHEMAANSLFTFARLHLLYIIGVHEQNDTLFQHIEPFVNTFQHVLLALLLVHGDI